MALKTLLVCLTAPEHADTLMKVAVPLARKHNAHLIGLHTIEALVVYPGIAMHIPEPAFKVFNDSQREQSAKIKDIFSHHTKNEDFPSEFRLLRAESATATERMIESARAADLVIAALADKDIDRFDQRHAQENLIRSSGRPVIVVPTNYEGPDIGANILIGWTDTGESARAAHDVLSFADQGAEVTLLRVGTPPADTLRDADAIDIAETIARHGFKTTLDTRTKDGDSVAEVLENTAFEIGADLIVTGAYGHSKAYDFVIGATTQALLRDVRMPVMFSK